MVAPPPQPNNNPVSLTKRQEAFGYGEDDIKFVLRPMAEKGAEAIGSMAVSYTHLDVYKRQAGQAFTHFGSPSQRKHLLAFCFSRSKLIMSHGQAF